MKIGLTYDLRDDYIKEGYSLEETAEFDKIETVEAIESSLKKLGFETVRIGHIKHLIHALELGQRWDMVFNIAEGLRGIARESQIPALLDAYRIPYTFSDPTVLGIALHKGFTKRIIRDLGLTTPDFTLIYSLEDLSRFNLPFPVFAKPVGEGTGKGIHARSKIIDFAQLQEVVGDLLNQFQQPILVERYLSGREFTVGLLGTGLAARTIGTLEIVLNAHAEQIGYSYLNKQDYENRVSYHLIQDSIADQCQELALAAWRGLECRDAGRIDLKADADGTIHFLEVNPLAGLHPIDSDLPILCHQKGIRYEELISGIMESALLRTEMRNVIVQRTTCDVQRELCNH